MQRNPKEKKNDSKGAKRFSRQTKTREVQQKTSRRNSLNRRQQLNVLSAAKSSERSNKKVLGKCPSELTGLRVEGRQDRGKGLKSDGKRNAF